MFTSKSQCFFNFFSRECLTKSKMLHHIILYATQFSFKLTMKKAYFIQYIFLADFKQNCVWYTTCYAKQTSRNTFAYAYENVNMLHHFSFEYHVDFFPPWMLLYQISAPFFFFFFPNDSTVKPTLSCTVLWHTARLLEAKANGKNQPLITEYICTDFSHLVTALQT